MVFFTNLTLSKKVSIIVLAGLVVGLGLFSWLGLEALNKSTDRILNERLTISRIIASYMDDTLNSVLVQSQSVAHFDSALPTAEQFDKSASSLYDVFGKTHISVRRIFLVAADGVVIRSWPAETSTIGFNLAEYDEVKLALQTGAATISGLIVNPQVSLPAEYVTVPITDARGMTTGAIVSAIDIQGSDIGALAKTAAVGQTAYAEIVDANGIVLARTKPGFSSVVIEKSDHPDRFAQLIREGEATVRTCHRCHETSQNVQRRADVLAFAPLSEASWGVAVRQAQEEALAPTLQLQRQLLFLGIIVLVGTFLLLWSVMQGVIKPIKGLIGAFNRARGGDFKMSRPPERRDEIGQLSQSFYTMTTELARFRDELVSRNRELMALNSIAATVGQSLDLQQMLVRALEKVLGVTGAPAGVIYLARTPDSALEKISTRGSSTITQCRQSSLVHANCACHQALTHTQTRLVNHVSQCPLLGDKELEGAPQSCFVCVPLRYQDRTLGIMNIIYDCEQDFTESDFRLLDSIGYHIGLALENAELYESVKQKEEARGKLLNSVITAQEEERKRVAREIHDEYGQTLAGLMLSIESLEGMISPEQNHLKGKIEGAKKVVAIALEDMRRLALDLRPAALDDLGLAAAIRSYARGSLEAAGIKVKLEMEGLNRRLAPAIETALFRIIQEGLHNIGKHANADSVLIRLEAEDSKILASIEDNGRGFDVSTLKGKAKSLGLIGIQERTAILGGTFHVESQPGRGTQIRVEIPLNGTLASPVAATVKDL